MIIPIKKCSVCSSEFKPTNNKQKHCLICRKIKKDYYWKRFCKPTFVCKICNIEFNNTKGREYCIDCARTRRNELKKIRREKKRTDRKCAMCDNVFRYNSGPQKYCDNCKYINEKIKKKENSIRKGHGTGFGLRNKICEYCNNEFKPTCGPQKYCKDCVKQVRKEKQKECDLKSKEKRLESDRIYRKNNRERINELSKISKAKRRKNDPLFVLSNKVGCMMRDALVRKNRYKKEKHSVEYLGCSIQFLKEHLEKQWDKTMSWENYGKYPDGWDIDHIKPVSSAKTLEELIPLLHYTNLQPLNSKYNREVKRDRLEI
jgi:hypothetical protein